MPYIDLTTVRNTFNEKGDPSNLLAAHYWYEDDVWYVFLNDKWRYVADLKPIDGSED